MFLWIAAVQVIGYAEVQTRDKTSCLLLTVDFVFLIHVKFLSKCTSPVGLQDLVEHCTSEFCLKHFFWNVKKKVKFPPFVRIQIFLILYRLLTFVLYWKPCWLPRRKSTTVLSSNQEISYCRVSIPHWSSTPTFSRQMSLLLYKT